MNAVADQQQDEWLEANEVRLDQLLSETSDASILRMFFAYFYANRAGTGDNSTLEKIASRITIKRIKKEFMTLAEALERKGRAEGILIGEIKSCRRLLGKKALSLEEFEALSRIELERQLASLQRELESKSRRN